MASKQVLASNELSCARGLGSGAMVREDQAAGRSIDDYVIVRHPNQNCILVQVKRLEVPDKERAELKHLEDLTQYLMHLERA